MSITIRLATAADRAAWLSLWMQYCHHYEVELDARITERTWERIVDADAPIHALLAFDEHGTALGLCNYVCHPHTWSDQTICYLEDLFVAPQGRRQGTATALIETLRERGIAAHWRRIYWITNEANVDAQRVYDRLATRSGHVRYEIALD